MRILFLALAFIAATWLTANAQAKRPDSLAISADEAQRFGQMYNGSTLEYGQQPATMEAELGPPVYDTLARSGGVNWTAYGYLYAPGTFDNLDACAMPPIGAQIIGSYRIIGFAGNAAHHDAIYRLSFGNPNDGKQFVFGGTIDPLANESGIPMADTYSAAQLVRGRFEEGWEATYQARSSACLGGRVMVTVQAASVRQIQSARDY